MEEKQQEMQGQCGQDTEGKRTGWGGKKGKGEVGVRKVMDGMGREDGRMHVWGGVGERNGLEQNGLGGAGEQ